MILSRAAVTSWIAFAVIAFTGCGKKDVLHEAVMNDDLEKVRSLLKSNPNLVSSRDATGRAPLFYAENRTMVELLIANKAEVNADKGIGVTPLARAALMGKSEVVESLVAHGADVNSQDSPLGSLIMARNTNAARLTELFLAHGADVNARESIGRKTLLHFAAGSGLKNVVELLLAHGADINARDYDRATPLHEAAYHLETAEVLLASKADVDARNKRGETPLHWAISSHHGKVAELLLAHGADVNARDYDGMTPLAKAAESRSKAEAELLLANGADVNLNDFSGISPLGWAVLFGRKDVAELLLASGADVNSRDDQGRTPLHLARFSHPELAELLRQHAAANTR